MENGKLPVRTKLAFGVCDLGGNLFFTITAFLLMAFLTDTVGLSASLAGTALMVGRSFDAVMDPLVGYLSDRTRTRWGRRRPFMFGGSFLLALGMYLMFRHPGFTDQTSLFWWALLTYCFLSTSYTLVNIPYSSLTPELTDDYNERTSLNGYRMSFAVIGTLLGAGAAIPIVGLFPDKVQGFSSMGAIFGLIMLVTALLTVVSIREKAPTVQTEHMGLLANYLSALKSRPFQLILIPFTLNITALTILSSVLLYYFRYIYKVPDETTNIAMLILLVSAMVFIPVWVKIAGKIGKKPSLIIGMCLLAASMTFFFFTGHRWGLHFAFGMMIFNGLGLATGYVLPWSIVPDAIEADYVETGIRREGVFYGLWTFASKIGQAFSALLVGWTLDSFGYVPGVEQSDSALLGIRLLFGPIAAAIYVLGAVIHTRYPITEALYQEIRAKAQAMQGQEERSRG